VRFSALLQASMIRLIQAIYSERIERSNLGVEWPVDWLDGSRLAPQFFSAMNFLAGTTG
jgi:hypothetical protein